MAVRIKQPGHKIIERTGRTVRHRIGGGVTRRGRILGVVSGPRIDVFDGSLLHPLLPERIDHPVTLSVVTGTYNRLPLLQKCIASVRAAARGTSLEIIVCDGNSTDGTVAWLQDQPDVRLIHGGLDGAVKAFNMAAREARGRFIMALNDDAELEPNAIETALAYFEDPMVGQVAMQFHEGGAWKFQHIHGRVYANFSITRANIVDAVTEISGGMWASCYYTYGGDTELSCWVYRLGYKIVAAQDSRLRHLEHADTLRSRNTRMDRKRALFWKRWATPEMLAFRGPTPGVESREASVLARVEVGESPSSRWTRIAALDPNPGSLPARRVPRPERVLHWHLWTADDPQSSMSAALRSMGTAGHACIPWTTMSAAERGRSFVEAARQLRPTVAFLQLQARDAVPVEALRAMRMAKEHDPSLVLVVWSGDIGPGKGPWAGSGDDWQFQIAREVDLMLFTGTGQVQRLRERGMVNAAYLQIGFDTDRYHPGHDDGYGSKHSLVFMGQNYGPQFDRVPDSDAQLRRDAVAALRRVQGFVAYGSGFGPSMAQIEAGSAYRSSSLAMSISLTSRLARYTSDRMIRSMASGCPTLVKHFDDMDGLGLAHRENCLVWHDTHDLVEQAQHWLDPQRREDLRAIGRAGAKLMHSEHTWAVRMHELSALLAAVRGQP